MSAEPKVLVGVIGGSGLYGLDNLTPVKEVNVTTPWGEPSSPISIMSLPSGELVAFLARHGLHHTIAPSAVPARANIAALKSLGVRVILAFSAVGSLREEIKPGDFVLPSQIIDRTKGVRPASFFEGTGVVAHAGFGDPFSGKVTSWLESRIKEVLDADSGKVALHTDKTIVCMEGPQFSTRAESKMYRAWGGDIINMSVLPEAKLAREAEVGYALVATSTDYDSWRVSEEPVTAFEVIKTLKGNAALSKKVAASVLGALHAVVSDEKSADFVLSSDVGSMAFSIMPRHDEGDPEQIKKLAFILPTYFGPQSQQK